MVWRSGRIIGKVHLSAGVSDQAPQTICHGPARVVLVPTAPGCCPSAAPRTGPDPQGPQSDFGRPPPPALRAVLAWAIRSRALARLSWAPRPAPGRCSTPLVELGLGQARITPRLVSRWGTGGPRERRGVDEQAPSTDTSTSQNRLNWVEGLDTCLKLIPLQASMLTQAVSPRSDTPHPSSMVLGPERRTCLLHGHLRKPVSPSASRRRFSFGTMADVPLVCPTTKVTG
jgi:hypothetical protein